MHSKAIHKNKSTLDLNKVRDIIFQDIYKLLDSFGLEYTQDGDNIFMKCPIHEGSDNPNALSISLDKKVWRCWTRGCQDHYSCNIWGFIKGVLDTDSFSEALKYVCKLYDVNGVSKSGNTTTNGCIDNEFSSLVRRISSSEQQGGKIEQEGLVTKPSIESTPSPYFLSRGYKKETLQFFGVCDSNDKTGSFKSRAVIPISNADGMEIGYIGRATRDFIQTKYIWSKGFRKLQHLYNYHNALESVVQLNTLFLVEGQGDVWRLWECGVKNVVGLFGSEVSEAQKRLLLSSGVTQLIVLTDNDQAGRESKIKIKREMGRLFKLIFPKMSNKDLGDMSKDKIQEQILDNLKGYYK